MANFRLVVQCLLSLSVLHAAAKKDDATTDVPLDSTGRFTGPLTTTFTPPESCLKEIHTTQSYGYPYLVLGCLGPAGNECCPSNWAKNRYFSPGVCPSGYQACTLPTTRQREETTNVCCPQNFDCPTDTIDYLCHSYVNTQVELPWTDISSTKTARLSKITATAIQIRFKASDSDVVPIPTESFNLPGPAVGLSTGAKAGIGVGVAVVVVGILATCYFLIKRRKSRQPAPQDVALLNVALEPEPEESPPPYSKGR
ncbi:uncharacterized protein DNG_04422 [Cephalotrichum gorgonifer]|uniref:Uncharacterized protein n=1 Tax=Cephalotrichum gorgonifer TaxID=2041049 RepID=A0AAE8MY16_9PEZI|nr:uncharacterized protein DNG_04422 [Cephalotrichum gorgonifer]